MFNVIEGNTYEVWVNGKLVGETMLLKEDKTILIFNDITIDRANIDALRLVG